MRTDKNTKNHKALRYRSKQQPYKNLNAAGKPSSVIFKHCPNYVKEGKLL